MHIPFPAIIETDCTTSDSVFCKAQSETVLEAAFYGGLMLLSTVLFVVIYGTYRFIKGCLETFVDWAIPENKTVKVRWEQFNKQ